VATPGIVPLVVVATDPASEIRRVEFYDGSILLGVSEILTKDMIVPGRPRTHAWNWTNPPVGPHGLAAIAVASDGTQLAAKLSLVAQTPDNVAATIVWKQPSEGDRFEAGKPIPFLVVARDPAGLLFHVDFFAGDQKIGFSDWSCPVCKPARGAELQHEFVWTDAPPGLHTLRAESTDAAGARVVSAPVTITVGDPVPPKVVATRRLPGTFAGGVEFTVTIDVVPPPGTQAYVVIDHPPFLHEGGAVPPPEMPWWHVTGVDGGAFDGPNLAVKFGPFFGSDPRTLTYRITPNDAIVEQAVFDGQFVGDGADSAIGGDTVIAGSRRHPADLAPADDRISAEELTAYAATWRLGKPWAGQTIPMDYVTKAGELWRGGEHYRFDASAGPAPLWWVSAPLLVPSGGPGGAVGIGTAEAPAQLGLAAARWTPPANGAEQTLEVSLIPGPRISAHALELKVGAKPAAINESGVYDEATGLVRWGPFTDGAARTLRCTFAGATKVGYAGQASFDGRAVPLTAAISTDGAKSAPRLLGVSRTGDGGMQVVVEDASIAAGGALRLEYSTDLRHWTPIGNFSNGPAAAFARDGSPATDVPRFYRAVRAN
jgi:hypothetical protein